MSNLLKDNKELMLKYNYEKNRNIDLNNITLGTHKKIWWRCHKGHEWEASVWNIYKGKGCPFCSGRKRIIGVNDFATLYPELMKEWNYEKNEGIDPTNIGSGSSKSVWWKCNKGHEWRTSIANRTNDSNKTNCPYCSNRKILIGYNDLFTTNPELKNEWDYKKNKIDPLTIGKGSPKRVWWKCSECGYSYQTICYSRAKMGTNCPNCAKRNTKERCIKASLKNKQSLFDLNPSYLKEWDYEKNMISPNEITIRSGRKVWWKCPKGHEWLESPHVRGMGYGCPICNSGTQSSFAEQAIYYYMKKIFSNTKNRYKVENKYEIDVFIPELNLGIEYDGSRFHKDIAKDLEKEKRIKSFGIDLIRIKELPRNSKKKSEMKSNVIYCQYNNDKLYLNDIIEKIYIKLGISNYDIDVNRDKILIMEQYLISEKENSIIKFKPELEKEWDYGKNGEIRPEYVPKGSNHKFWWKCQFGHNWEASPNSRLRGRGCPICANINKKKTN